MKMKILIKSWEVDQLCTSLSQIDWSFLNWASDPHLQPDWIKSTRPIRVVSSLIITIIIILEHIAKWLVLPYLCIKNCHNYICVFWLFYLSTHAYSNPSTKTENQQHQHEGSPYHGSMKVQVNQKRPKQGKEDKEKFNYLYIISTWMTDCFRLFGF